MHHQEKGHIEEKKTVTEVMSYRARFKKCHLINIIYILYFRSQRSMSACPELHVRNLFN